MTALDYKKEVRRVMDYVLSAGDFDLPQEDMRLLKHAYDNGYIEGIAVLQMAAGNIVSEVRHEPKITLKGLEFFDQLDQEMDADKNKHKARVQEFFHRIKPIQVVAAAIITLAGVAIGALSDLPGAIDTLRTLFPKFFD